MKENNDLARVFDLMKVIPDEIIFFDGQDFITCPQFDFKAPNSHDIVADILYEYYKQERALNNPNDAFFNVIGDFHLSTIPGDDNKSYRLKIVDEIERLQSIDKWKRRTIILRHLQKLNRPTSIGPEVQSDFLPF